MPAASKWPLAHTLGHQGPQKGALRIAFGAKDVEFGRLWAPKVLKMIPFGTPLGAKSVFGSLSGALVQPAVDLVMFVAHLGGHLGAYWG